LNGIWKIQPRNIRYNQYSPHRCVVCPPTRWRHVQELVWTESALVRSNCSNSPSSSTLIRRPSVYSHFQWWSARKQNAMITLVPAR
jgi:hypothetical protein